MQLLSEKIRAEAAEKGAENVKYVLSYPGSRLAIDRTAALAADNSLGMEYLGQSSLGGSLGPCRVLVRVSAKNICGD